MHRCLKDNGYLELTGICYMRALYLADRFSQAHNGVTTENVDDFGLDVLIAHAFYTSLVMFLSRYKREKKILPSMQEVLSSSFLQRHRQLLRK